MKPPGVCPNLPRTQAEFGALVGISQQAVSEHLAASMSLASLSAMDDEDPQEATA